KKPLERSRCFRRKIAEREGVNVSALKAEIETENAMVRANCRNKIPVVPGKSATGTNTDTSTSEVATTAPATSFMATKAALCGSVMPSVMWRSTFSITTMASSTTRPVARVMPKSVRVLMENPKALTKMKVPTRETGMVMAGMKVLRQSCREKEKKKMNRMKASISGFSTSPGGLPITLGGSKAT